MMMTKIRPAFARLNAAACPRPAGEPLTLVASVLAHDLNNVLQIVSGNLAMLAQADMDERARHRIENSLVAIRVGAELTNGVLELARQKTSPSSATTMIDRDGLVTMAPLIRDTAGDGMEVVFSFSDDLWAFPANIHRLQNAMINLVVNARDAMNGRGRLWLGARNVTCPVLGRQVWLTVADEGPGIPADMLENVFAPFSTTKPHGTGLGLSIVAEFARASGADVLIDSRVGLGTSVTIEFVCSPD